MVRQTQKLLEPEPFSQLPKRLRRVLNNNKHSTMPERSGLKTTSLQFKQSTMPQSQLRTPLTQP